MTAWYIARARFDRARQIAEAISRPPIVEDGHDRPGLGYETLCPVDRQNGFDRYHHKQIKLVPVFGPYFFFKAEMTDNEVWHQIADWPHVAEIMGGSNPWPVIDEEIIFWRQNTDDKGILTDPDLIEKIRKFGKFMIAVGDTVRVTHPPYDGRIGRCVWIDIKKIRLGVEIEGLLGRDTVIPVLAAWCKKIEVSVDPLHKRAHRPGHGGGRRGQRVRRLAKLRHQ
jgi:transcription antitermination factor NusG